MTRKEAIKIIEKIQEGSGVDRERYPEGWIGEVPRKEWNNPIFGLGIEYGYILALCDIFNIREGYSDEKGE